MDFFTIEQRSIKKGSIEVSCDPCVERSKDLMIRGKSFYAVWDEKKNMWSTDEWDVPRIVDSELMRVAEKLRGETEDKVTVKRLRNFNTNAWRTWKNFISSAPDNYHQLDCKVTFQDTVVTKEDYVSKRLPYSLSDGPCPAYEELMSTLYAPEERAKIEWAIGSIIAGDSTEIQKFIVLYGEGGTGKSTVLNIIIQLFKGYYCVFDAKSLGSSSAQFATEAFQENPLVAIQQDGDLSKIEDNTRLNTIIAHEEMLMNVKHKSGFMMKMNPMLFIGTNSPVKITNAKSGLIRRLIDVRPTGNKLPYRRYAKLKKEIEFELGAIANHCLNVYKDMGIDYYGDYISRPMMLETNDFYNFIVDNADRFVQFGGVTVKSAFDQYKKYCEDSGYKKILKRNEFVSEIKNYFGTFYDKTTVNGEQVRSWLTDFKEDKISATKKEKEPEKYWLEMNCTESLLDSEFADCLAQYDPDETDATYMVHWNECKTTIKDLDTHKTHYARFPVNIVTMDFDFKDETGKKSPERNLMEASKWPPTYAEFSKSGGGIHLVYNYTGNPAQLATCINENIEIKTCVGKGSIRRKVSKCNNMPIATLSSGLPVKEVTKTVDQNVIRSEKRLREMVANCLMKKYEPYKTVTNINFMKKILDDCYANKDFHYDVSDMMQDVLAFANNSTNSSKECIRTFLQMHFRSEDVADPVPTAEGSPIVFFDIEVYPNLLLLVWKFAGPNNKCIIVYNPTPAYLEGFFKFKLVGFNNLRYDNPILYYRYLGGTVQGCYDLSQQIIVGGKEMVTEGRNISYTDVFEFCTKKQSLKKWECELDAPHKEMELDWNKPVAEELWPKIADYCCNDVLATEAVWNANQGDFEARLMLVKLCEIFGLKASPNNTTNQLTVKLITRGRKNPQSEFVYTDLSTIYPGYRFEHGKSYYRGIETGEGGLVRAKPGIYHNVWSFDADSMHPHSIMALGLFGPEMTANFKDLVDLRMAVKSGNYDKARAMFDGALAPYLNDESEAKVLGQALKIAINSVYGLTAAKFPNALKDDRNVDNIVAKYGALFMVNLYEEVVARGYEVVHIKTDSIKIVNPDQAVVDFINDYAAKYGFRFKIEAKYERFCLINDAVYIAKEEEEGWTATGAQFKQPYVFKKLFSKEPIEFKDLCETKAVTTSMYLDFNEDCEAEGELVEKELKKARSKLLKTNEPDAIKELQDRIDELEKESAKYHDYLFVGKVGKFVPVKPGCNGGRIMRKSGDKYSSVGGTKDFRWKEAELVHSLKLEDEIDLTYHEGLAKAAIKAISEFGDFEAFVAEDNEEEINNVA